MVIVVTVLGVVGQESGGELALRGGDMGTAVLKR